MPQDASIIISLSRHNELLQKEKALKEYLDTRNKAIIASYDFNERAVVYYDEQSKDRIKKIIDGILDDYYSNSNKKGVTFSCPNPVEPKKTWLARLFD